MGGVRRNLDTPIEAGAVFPDSPKKEKSSSDEGSAWFWRIFGGTILGAITFLLVTLLNHLNNNIESIRQQNQQWQKEVQVEVTGLRDRVVKAEETLSTIKEAQKELDVTALRERVSAIEQGRELDKERKTMIDDRLKALEEDVKELHKNLGAAKPSTQDGE